jgi:drug/metabolite transporter (DMT)-like permease
MKLPSLKGHGHLVLVALGGIAGIIGAAYLSTYVSSAIAGLVAGAVLLAIPMFIWKNEKGSPWIAAGRIALGLAGVLFVLRGGFGLVDMVAPGTKAAVDQYTLNIV